MDRSAPARAESAPAVAEDALVRRIARAVPADPEGIEVARHRLAEAEAADGALARLLGGEGGARAALLAVLSNSPYLLSLAAADPARLSAILAAPPEETVARAIEATRAARGDRAAVMAALRRQKQAVALTVGLADLWGVSSLEEVTGALSDFADAAVAAAVDHLLREGADKGRFRLEDPARPGVASGLVVLGMGKLGGRELNYSSDIDLVVFYDRRRGAAVDALEANRHFVRLARDLVTILQERTPEGYVFRTDLRLRPDPGANPPAVAVDSAVQYYATRGASWERSAFIKARPVAGDEAAARLFLRAIRPFVWRRQADFAAVEDVDEIREKMLTVRGQGAITVPGHDVKVGRGGIREIEFIVQTRQLIAGGRSAVFRGRETLPMLAALGANGWLEERTVRDLDAAYRFLRTVEHRLQMVADDQTHRMPADEAGIARIARLMGEEEPGRFHAMLRDVLTTVFDHYRALFSHVTDSDFDPSPVIAAARGDDDGERAAQMLRAAGYERPEAVVAAVRRWLRGEYPATRTERARRLVSVILPEILTDISSLADVSADEAFAAFDLFVSQLPAGIRFFTLLRNNPDLLRLFALVMGVAPRLARVLTRRPRLLDVLIDPAFYGRNPSEEDVRAALAEALADADAYEMVLDRLRVFGQEQRFLISVKVLTGSLAAKDTGEAFADLADTLVTAALEAARAEFAKRHGHVPGGEVALLALGKLGGREMTASSDLDLILVYDHDPDATQSDGERPLAPSQYFVRLTQRLVAALSAATAEGTLYEVDFRLRPSGNAGPLATSLSSFARYQTESAWTWEHMALTRARIIAGEEGITGRLRAVITEALSRPRDREALAKDIGEMRARIQKEKGARDHWRLKTVPGGLIDVEFLAQYAQLAVAADHPEALAISTADQLARAADVGFYDAAKAETLSRALALYQPLSQVLRVALDGEFEAASAQPGLVRLLLRAGDAPDFAYLEATLKEAEAAVAQTFEKTLG